MFQTGLVSVSFRQLSADAVLALAAKSGLSAIEWGGDVHVPAGSDRLAAELGRKTREAGLAVASYGSYYRLGRSGDRAREMETLLGTASALGAPMVRIWAGELGSDEASHAYRAALASEARTLCKRAQAYGLRIGLECHHKTLTDAYPSTLDFLQAVGCEQLSTYWQPNQRKSDAYNLAAAEMLRPYCRYLHVFHWDAQSRYPLADGARIWRQYLDIFASDGRSRTLLLEFMHDDRPESLPQTAETLRQWAAAYRKNG